MNTFLVHNILDSSFHFFEKQVVKISEQQQKVAIVALTAVSMLAAAIAIYRYCYRAKVEEEDKQFSPLADENEDIFLLRFKKEKGAEEVKTPLPLPLIKDHKHTFLYLESEEIEKVGMVEKETYREAVRQLPICCVDIFLFNPADQTYLLVLRKDPPAKGTWWLPGGRLYKGETFFECSVRKCKEEVGLDVTPIKSLGFAATLFPDSMWDTQTHTVNFIVLAQVNSQTHPHIDKTCESYQWKHIDDAPDDGYVYTAYVRALLYLTEKKAKVLNTDSL